MNWLDNFCFWLEELPLSIVIGETWIFPLIESIHVIGAVFILGAILMADLRLMGLAAKSYSAATFIGQLLPWSIMGFIVAIITGLGMFITRASGYIYNPAFLWKMVLLVLACGNVIVFHKWLKTRVENAAGPNFDVRVKLCAASSLILWCGIMLTGRWIGHIF